MSEQSDRKREQEMYGREQELTRLFRDALNAFREEAERAVGQAARSSLPTSDSWEEAVRRVVREEVARAVSVERGLRREEAASSREGSRKLPPELPEAAVARGDKSASGREGRADGAEGRSDGAEAAPMSRQWNWGDVALRAWIAVALLGSGWAGGVLLGPWPAGTGESNAVPAATVPVVGQDTTGALLGDEPLDTGDVPPDTLGNRSDSPGGPPDSLPGAPPDSATDGSTGTSARTSTDAQTDIGTDISSIEMPFGGVPEWFADNPNVPSGDGIS